jgi:hypothetical protein
MENSTAVIADFGGERRSGFFAKSRTPPPLTPIDPPKSQTVVRQGDFWRQCSAMGRAIGDRGRGRSPLIDDLPSRLLWKEFNQSVDKRC